MNRIYAFWTNDRFPFVLGGEGEMQENGDVFVAAYGGTFRRKFIVAMYPVKLGKEIQAKLDAVEEEHRHQLRQVMSAGMDRAGEALPELRPWRAAQGRTPA